MAEMDQDSDDDFDIDALENEFFEQFMSTDDQQLSDPDHEGEAQGLTEHSTLDAVRTVFEDRLSEAQLEELAEDLDITSESWVSIDEYRALNDEPEIEELEFDDDED